jgi:carbonic anhydrase
MQKLIDGVRCFYRGHFAENRPFFERLAARSQQPIALFITCADSRVNPNLITQTEPGDLFLLRNAGNIVPPHGAGGSEAATIEYSLEVLGISDIIVCGHSQCGAIQALLDQQRLMHLPAVQRWCDHAEATRRIVRQKYGSRLASEIAEAAAQENVLVQLNHLQTHPAVAVRLNNGAVRLYGWYYNIATGVVSQYYPARNAFLPLIDERLPPQGAPAAHHEAAQAGGRALNIQEGPRNELAHGS